MAYQVKYQLSDTPVGRPHRTMKAAIRDLKSCMRAAANGGDCQAIYIIDDETDEIILFELD